MSKTRLGQDKDAQVAVWAVGLCLVGALGYYLVTEDNCTQCSNSMTAPSANMPGTVISAKTNPGNQPSNNLTVPEMNAQTIVGMEH